MADNTIVKEQEDKKKQDKMLVILPDGSEALAPSHEALQGVAQNKWKLPETDVDGLEMTVPISDAQGTFEVSARDINQNINDFVDDPNTDVTSMDRVMADEAERRKEIVSDAFDMPLTAFGAGAFRGATFGASDVLIEQTLGKEALKNLKEENKTASLIGDIAGTVIPAVATGGKSLAARALQKTGAGIATQIANKAGGKAAAKIIKKYKIDNPLAQNAIKLGTTGAVEGALYSGGRSLVDEALLGDEKANYAKVLEDTLTGGLFEGALGAGLGPAANLLANAGKAGVSKVTELAKHPKLWDGVKKSYANAMGVVKGKDAKKAIDDVFNAEKYNQDDVARYMDDITEADRDLGSTIQKMMGETERVEATSKMLRNRALSNPELDAHWSTNEKFNEQFGKVEADFSKAFERILDKSDLVEKNSLKIVDNIQKHLHPERVYTMRDFAIGLRDAKKEADDYIKLYAQKAKGPMPTIRQDERETYNILLDLKEGIDETLKDYSVFGKSAKDLKLADQIYSSIVEPARKIRTLGRTEGYKLVNEGAEIPGLQKELQFDPITVAEMMRKRTSRKRKINLENAVNSIESSLNKINKKMPELGLDSTFTQELDRMKKNLELSRGITSLESSTGKNLRGMVFGSFVGGTPGAIAGLVLENPIVVTKMLVNMEKNSNKFQKAIDNFGNTFTKKLPKTTAPLNVIHPVIHNLTGTKKDEDPKKVIEKFNSGEVYEHLDNRIQMIESAAPKHAAIMRQQTQMANNLVAQELPPVVQSGVLGRDTKLVMTPSQTQRVNQVMLASYAPKTFLEYIKNGTATKAGMNALKEIHPNLFFELQQQAAQTIVNKDVPYQNKMKLQYMFELPATFELSDISLKQSAYASAGNSQERQQNGRPDPTGSLRAKGLDQMERSVENAAPSAQFG